LSAVVGLAISNIDGKESVGSTKLLDLIFGHLEENATAQGRRTHFPCALCTLHDLIVCFLNRSHEEKSSLLEIGDAGKISLHVIGERLIGSATGVLRTCTPSTTISDTSNDATSEERASEEVAVW